MIAAILAAGSRSHNEERAPAAPIVAWTERVEWPLHAEIGREHVEEPAKERDSNLRNRILDSVAFDRLAGRSARTCGRCARRPAPVRAQLRRERNQRCFDVVARCGCGQAARI